MSDYLAADVIGHPNLVRSPVQAKNTFSQLGGTPRQRNVFLVRFLLNGQGQGQTTGNATMQSLTFAAKSIDRPRVNPKVEEVNEYNKRRQVYTGYKLEPVKVQFYDSADGAAQNMWTKYARYYFGDFNQGCEQGYHYTATNNEFPDYKGYGYGFTGANGGQTDPNAQFFFRQIDLFHFYDGKYDKYSLFNPRIDMFDPDELSYDNSDIAMINASFVYENLQYYPQQTVDANAFSEFVSGNFFGNPLIIPETGWLASSTDDFSMEYPSNPLVAALLNNIVGSLGRSYDYRYSSSPSTGALGLYGNFIFGSPSPYNLTAASYSNPALAAALSLGAMSDPLAAQNAMLYNAQAASRGIDPATYDYMYAQAAANTSGRGNIGQILTRGLLASAAMGVIEGAMPRGVVYDPTVYGAINAQQTGTAQFGYTDGASYNPYQPAGLYGRYGIIEEPLAPPESAPSP